MCVCVCVCVCMFVCAHAHTCGMGVWVGVPVHVKGKCVHRSMCGKGGFGVCVYAHVMWAWVYA